MLCLGYCSRVKASAVLELATDGKRSHPHQTTLYHWCLETGESTEIPLGLAAGDVWIYRIMLQCVLCNTHK